MRGVGLGSSEALYLQPKAEAPKSSAYDVLHEVFGDFGVPRLGSARKYFLPLLQEDIPLLKEAFRSWQGYDEYMLLKGEQFKTGKEMFLAVKCSKRGNDVFARRLDRRLGFLGRIRDVKLFDVMDFKPSKVVETNLLWVTLTYGSRRCTLDQAWSWCMDEYNTFITNLRNRYGKIDVLRFIQPFDDPKGEAYGYPHFHLVLLFREAQFRVFPHMEKDSARAMALRFRVREKYELEAQGRWHSFVDVQALSSVRAVANYCRKYAQNVCYGDSEKAVLNGAVAWLYRKQTFSLSGGFRENYSEFISHLQLSKGSMEQQTLDGDVFPCWAWEFCGIRSAGDLGIAEGDVWVKSLTVDEFETAVRRHG